MHLYAFISNFTARTTERGATIVKIFADFRLIFEDFKFFGKKIQLENGKKLFLDQFLRKIEKKIF